MVDLKLCATNEINMDAATFEVIWWQNEDQNKLMVLYYIPRNYKQNHDTSYLEQVLKRLLLTYWVNPSKRGGMDWVFRGLAGLLRGISRG